MGWDQRSCTRDVPAHLNLSLDKANRQQSTLYTQHTPVKMNLALSLFSLLLLLDIFGLFLLLALSVLHFVCEKENSCAFFSFLPF